VFELGTARAKHPSIDYELEIRQLTGFPVVYDAEAVLEGYSNPGHFRYSSSRNQRGVVSVAPVVPTATDSPASHTILRHPPVQLFLHLRCHLPAVAAVYQQLHYLDLTPIRTPPEADDAA
jgi:hypothetical protein